MLSLLHTAFMVFPTQQLQLQYSLPSAEQEEEWECWHFQGHNSDMENKTCSLKWIINKENSLATATMWLPKLF